MPKLVIQFTAGDKVRQVLPKPFEGIVIDTRLLDGKPEYLVEWTETFPEGGSHTHQRWFKDEEGQIEALPDAPKPEVA